MAIITDIQKMMETLSAETNTETSVPNGIRVSATDNPTTFPAKNTYQVGSSEIVAMCSNAVAVGTGQTGDAPLYVFCKDGIYALFVDSSGQLTYTNARVIARDVCNNAKSVTPIDEGVVFTTDRGLMMIAGNEVVEIGQPLEGDYCKFADSGNIDYNRICANAYSKSLLAGLSVDSRTQTDFLDYLKHAIVAYNHNERELMICNILKKATGRLYYDYMYVLDRNGNWTRRDYNAEQFVENYPVTFRVADGKVYQMDEQSDTDNGIFALSNVVKLDSIGFKAVDRVVARGIFDSVGVNEKVFKTLSFESGSGTTVVDANEIYRKSFSISDPSSLHLDVSSLHFTFPDTAPDFDEDEDSDYFSIKVLKGTTVVKEIKRPLAFTQGVEIGAINEYVELAAGSYTIVATLYGVVDAGYEYQWDSDCAFAEYQDTTTANRYIGIYAFGSYDGRTWACLGHTERKGNFTDLGCNVERTDCKFFRFLVAGQIKKESRLDYFEISERASRLSTKIR